MIFSGPTNLGVKQEGLVDSVKRLATINSKNMPVQIDTIGIFFILACLCPFH